MSYPDLDRLIHAARGGEAPSAAERTQVREALARRIASGDALPDLDEASLAPPPARSWLAGAGAVSLGLGGLAVAALAALVAIYGLGREVPSEGLGSASARPGTPSEAAPDVEGVRAEAARGSTNASAPENARPTAASAMASGSSVSRDGSSRSAASRAASDAPARAATPARAHDAPRTLASGAGRAPRVDHEAERRALARVQHALRDGRFVEALAGLDRDDRAYAGGALVEERAAARVLARCGSGDAAEAQQLATAFVARYPGSPLRSRVLASCPASAGERAP